MADHDADELDRYWDALASGDTPDPFVLDPIRAETVRRFHEAEDVPSADPTFLARLLADLIPTDRIPEVAPETGVPTRSLNGRARLPMRFDASRQTVVRPRRLWFARVAVALLVIAVGLGVVIARPDDPDHPFTIPGAFRLDGFEGTLLELTLLPEEVPPSLGSGISGGLTAVTIAPGSRATWQGACCPGVRLNYILDGTLTVRPQGRMQIFRAGNHGVSETAPVDTEALLTPGDAFLVQNEVPFESTNLGANPVRLLMIDLTTQQNPVPGNWILGAFSGALNVAMPPGPVVIRLEQAQMDPGDERPSLPNDAVALMALAFVDNVSGTPESLSLDSQGGDPVLDRPFVSAKDEATIYVLTIEPIGWSPDSPVAASPVP